jgi:hypothetical protein
MILLCHKCRMLAVDPVGTHVNPVGMHVTDLSSSTEMCVARLSDVIEAGNTFWQSRRWLDLATSFITEQCFW